MIPAHRHARHLTLAAAATQPAVRVRDMAATATRDGSAPTGDPVVDATWETALEQARWLREHGRDGVDGRGGTFEIGVRAGATTHYDARSSMVLLGDDESTSWHPSWQSPETVRHELVHAAIDATAPGLMGSTDGRTIHEAWAMALQTIDDDDWLVGDDRYKPETAARSVAPFDLTDPQLVGLGHGESPGWEETRERLRLGSVAVHAADQLGRDATAQVWTRAIDHFTPGMAIDDARAATLQVALDRYGRTGADAVRHAWNAAGYTG